MRLTQKVELEQVVALKRIVYRLGVLRWPALLWVIKSADLR